MFRWSVLLVAAAGCGLPGIEHFHADAAAPSDTSLLEPAIDVPHPDAAPDARPDAPPDARPDAPPDAPPDARPDAPPDAAPDAPPDAPPGPCLQLPAITLAVATLAGCADAGEIDGVRGIARFDNPVNIAISPTTGLAIVADFDSSRLRTVDLAGTATTLVHRADITRPFGLVFGADGMLYMQTDDNDLGSHDTTTGTLWMIDPATGAATELDRNLGAPRGLVVLADGRIAMADHLHHVVAIFDPMDNDYEVLAGVYDTPGHVNAAGAAARFDSPYDLVMLDADTLLVADRGNHVLRTIALATGAVDDYAGTGAAGNTDGDQATTATFDQPQGLAIAADGTIYVSDVASRRVRRVASGSVVTIAGDGTAGWIDSDDPLAAEFYSIEGMDLTADGKMLVLADGNQGDGTAEHRVRVIHLDAPKIPAKRASLPGLFRASWRP